MQSEQSREDGFTLIEVLIALAILGVSLGIVLTTVSDSLARARRGESELVATSLAQSLLARAGPDLKLTGTDHKGNAGGFVWRLSTKAYGTEEDRNAWNADPVVLTATVAWFDSGEERSVSLQTVRIIPRKQEDLP